MAIRHIQIHSILVLLTIVAFGSFAKAGVMVSVHDKATLIKAAERAKAGDIIVLAPGIYNDCNLTLNAVGTKEAPIVIRSEKPHESIVSGKSFWEIRGQFIRIEALTFKGLHDGNERSTAGIVFLGAQFCRLTRCHFEDNEVRSLVAVVRGGAYNRVDHNTFTHNAAIHVNVSPSRDGIYPQFTRIDHNTFSDVPMIENGNGRETVKIGLSPYTWGELKAYTLVEFNTFIRCDGEPEIVSSKCSSNIFRQNTFDNCEGELVLRGGHDCVISGNTFNQCTGGIRLSGSRHLVLNNVITGSRGTDRYLDVPNDGSGIRLVYGADIKNPAYYFAVSECLIAHNTIADCLDVAIEIGSLQGRDLIATSNDGADGWNAKRFGKNTVLAVAPFDNQFANNLLSAKEGMLIRNVDAPKNTSRANLLITSGGADLGWHSELDEILAGPISLGNGRSLPADIPIKTDPVDLGEAVGSQPAQVGAYPPDTLAENATIQKWIELSPADAAWLFDGD